jgi:hypothetical protein
MGTRGGVSGQFWVILAGLLFSLVLIGPQGGSLASAQEITCESDAFRLCGADIPDRARVKSCLLHNISNLTPACRAQVHGGRSKHYHRAQHYGHSRRYGQ